MLPNRNDINRDNIHKKINSNKTLFFLFYLASFYKIMLDMDEYFFYDLFIFLLIQLPKSERSSPPWGGKKHFKNEAKEKRKNWMKIFY